MATGHGSGRFVIDPSVYRTDRGLVGCLTVWWLIWVPATALVTYLAYAERHIFFYIWLVFGYVGTVAVPYALLIRKRKQILEVSGKSLVVYYTGSLFGPKIEIDKQNLKALTLEAYDEESGYSLNLFQKHGFRHHRISLANFVHPKDKAILMEEIREFLQKHGFVFDVKNEMDR